MNTSPDPRMKHHPSFEEYWDKCVVLGGREKEFQRCARETWHARDAEVKELVECLKEMTEAFEARMGDWENPDFHECYNKAVSAIDRATK